MGANAVNTVAEALSPSVLEVSYLTPAQHSAAAAGHQGSKCAQCECAMWALYPLQLVC